MKRRAMYSCLSKLGSQYLRDPVRAGNIRKKEFIRGQFGGGGKWKKKGEDAYVMKEVRASVCSVSALSAVSR